MPWRRRSIASWFFIPRSTNGWSSVFARPNRKMAEVNRRQAFIVEGAEILPNDRGTAPGQWIDESDVSVILLPGPPHELKAMFARQCLQRLERRVPKQIIRTLVMRVAGMAESDLDQTIAPVYKKYENPVTTILAAAGDIQIHLRARCSTEAEAMALLAEVAGPIELLLGDRIYSRNGSPLEVTVGDALRKHNATLSVAESCTGGLLAERITSVPGSSEYFLGGFVTYSTRMKTEWLGVSAEMMRAIRRGQPRDRRGHGDGRAPPHGIARTRCRLPASRARNRRTMCPWAWSMWAAPMPTGCQVVHRHFLGDRARIRDFSAQMALDLLRKQLSKISA